MKQSPRARENPASDAPPFLALRFSRQPGKESAGRVAPFTEIPPEVLEAQRAEIGPLRRVVNFILLFTLGLALAVLVLAFAYQLVHRPEMLRQWGLETLAAMQGWLSAAGGLLP